MSFKIKYLNNGTRMAAVAFALATAASMSGCTVNPNTPISLGDVGQSITIDDDRYVRAYVNAKVIDANQVVPGIGYAATPMITAAARNGSLSVLRYLISAKADLNARTPDRDTAVMLAAHFADEDRERNAPSTMRYDQAVRMLAEAGASLENSDENAFTALAYAAYAGRDRTVTYLLEKGAKVNGMAHGRLAYAATPLMMAAMQGHRDIAMQILRAGADANVRIQNGMSAAELAQKNNHGHLLRALKCAESLKTGETFRGRCE